MAEKDGKKVIIKKTVTKKVTREPARNKKKNESKWTIGKGVPVDSKKIKWADKY